MVPHRSLPQKPRNSRAMTDVPEDIRKKAQALAQQIDETTPRGTKTRLITEALMQERGAQRERVYRMLSGIADLLAKRMTDSATPELLKALADAVNASDEPEPA